MLVVEQSGTKDRFEKDLEAKMNRLGDGLGIEDAISMWVLSSLYISSQNEEYIHLFPVNQVSSLKK